MFLKFNFSQLYQLYNINRYKRKRDDVSFASRTDCLRSLAHLRSIAYPRNLRVDIGLRLHSVAIVVVDDACASQLCYPDKILHTYYNDARGRVRVSEQTRQLVIEAAERMGYQRNSFVSALRTNRIGIVVP